MSVESISDTVTKTNVKTNENNIHEKHIPMKLTRKSQNMRKHFSTDFDTTSIKSNLQKNCKIQWQTLFVEQKQFWFCVPLLFITCLSYLNMYAARWFVYIYSGYSCITNDSIQTLGSYISSNKKIKWQYLWIWISLCLIGTNLYSYLMWDGDMSHGRLKSKGFDKNITDFNFAQVAAPVILLMLTKLGIPVSTSFMILTVFVTETKSFVKVIIKSLLGFVLGFAAPIIIQGIFAKLISNHVKKTAPHSSFRVIQWLSAGFLWCVWLMQDMSNVVISLPRQLKLWQFIVANLYLVLMLAYFFKNRGEKVQQVIDRKTRVDDTREATLINLLYALLLVYFKIQSKMPMSTTWVFVGLITGRELAMSAWKVGKSWKKSIYNGIIDVSKITVGFLISTIVGIIGNSVVRKSIFG